ncbi:DNA polymerase III subunit epsilon [Thalassotalea mangrovi]|uniref:DNA polymerase III subunit epsilon n=1 Tax=Thalassotalea mangrovi TaxID=2572245 RepID=A0A4U1B7B1_9GAMM|nr:DNA polymerase III subunit epsilon [Thalassotalea mangrovi]TKB45766.1 DNA polymerase III subunit epsilon [Thalassotalea mangrovi]
MQSTQERLIILDTETTGIDPKAGHRIVEIGCVEMVNRKLTGRSYHVYINPQMEMEQEVIDVHGLTNDFLADKPLFHQVANEFIEFIRGAELVIHNAKFDVGFMDHEFAMVNRGLPMTADICSITDTLAVSRDEFGSPKTLDYLAKFYRVDKLVDRTYHGALIDAQLLAFVYIEMTRRQNTLNLQHGDGNDGDSLGIRRLDANRAALPVVMAGTEELQAHEERLDIVEQKGSAPIWRASAEPIEAEKAQ